MTEKINYHLEFVIKSSPSLLFNYISTPSGLEQWFSDNVKSRGEQFIFIWENSEEHATLIHKKKQPFRKIQMGRSRRRYLFRIKNSN